MKRSAEASGAGAGRTPRRTRQRRALAILGSSLALVAAALAWWGIAGGTGATPGASEDARPDLLQAAPGAEGAGTGTGRVSVPAPPQEQVGQPAQTGEVAVTLLWAEGGAPVVGHDVVVTDVWTGSSPLRRVEGGVTGPDGRARIAIAPGSYVVAATFDCARPVRVEAGGATAVELRLPLAGLLAGRVVDDRDVPLADAEVIAVRGGLAGRASRIATSAADGTFRAPLATDHAFVQARKRGHGASAAVQVRTIHNDETTLELVLASVTTSVRGRVVDETNQPIAGARVTLETSHPPPRGSPYVEPGVRPDTRTAADGTFAFDDVPPGEGGCHASAPGHRAGGGEFRAEPGVVAEVHIVLGKGTRVVGRVLDAGGRPAAGVLVGTSRYLAARDQRTGADGGFVFDVLPGPVEIAARDRALGAALLRFDVADREVREVELRLAVEPVLEGQVVDERGGPVPDLWVLALPKDDRAWQPLPLDATDGDGRFRFVGCPTTPIDVKVRAGRIATGPVLAREEAAVPGGPPLRLVVRDAARPSVFLRVQIENPRRPSQPLQILVQEVGTGDREFTTVAPGQPARIGPLPAGAYRVQHAWSLHTTPPILGLDLGPITLAAGEERDLGTHGLATPTALRLTLRRSDGAPVRRPRLRLVPLAGGEPIAGTVTDDGEVYPFSFPPGRYRVEVEEWLEHAAGSAEVELRARETAALSITLPALRPCSLRLRVPAGRHPPYRTRGTLRGPAGGSRPLEFWNGHSRVGLTPGLYEVVVDAPGCRGSATFTVDDVRTAELRVDVAVQ